MLIYEPNERIGLDQVLRLVKWNPINTCVTNNIVSADTPSLTKLPLAIVWRTEDKTIQNPVIKNYKSNNSEVFHEDRFSIIIPIKRQELLSVICLQKVTERS